MTESAHPSHSPPATVADAWRSWIEYRSCGARPLRLSTRADYDSIWSRHLRPFFGDVRLSDINGTQVARFVVQASALGISPKRLANILVPLRACLRWHHRIGVLERDPTAWFDSPAPRPSERPVLSVAQIEQLLAALPAQYRSFVTFAAYVGARAGEIRALTWRDIDLERRTVRIDKTMYRNLVQSGTKTGNARVVPLPPHVTVMLADWRASCPPSESGLVFPGSTGRPLDLDTFRRRVFSKAVLAAGLPANLRIRDLRHTSASLYLAHGATLREVMDIHGWSQIQTASRYLHSFDTLARIAERLSASVAGLESSSAAGSD